MEKLFTEIRDAAAKSGARKLVLYGSRARGDHRNNSDIDLAVFGMPLENQPLFYEDIENLDTLLEFDIVFITDRTNKELLKNIDQDGVIIMNKYNEKLSNLKKAVGRLKEALSDYEKYQIDSIRDGIIQRFEFCTELAWKTIREYLLEQGFTDINGPKIVMKKAYSYGLLDEDTIWIQLINDRNLTSHIYDESFADTLLEKIRTTYYPLFCTLIKSLER